MTTETLNKEQVYDEKIHPLMSQIIAICQERNIGMVATFHIPTPENEGLRCSTVLIDREKGMGDNVEIGLAMLLRAAGSKQ